MIGYEIVATNTESPLSLHKTFLPERSLNNIVVYRRDVLMGHLIEITAQYPRNKGIDVLGVPNDTDALNIIGHQKCKSLRDPSCLGMTGKKVPRPMGTLDL